MWLWVIFSTIEMLRAKKCNMRLVQYSQWTKLKHFHQHIIVALLEGITWPYSVFCDQRKHRLSLEIRNKRGIGVFPYFYSCRALYYPYTKGGGIKNQNTGNQRHNFHIIKKWHKRIKERYRSLFFIFIFFWIYISVIWLLFPIS